MFLCHLVLPNSLFFFSVFDRLVIFPEVGEMVGSLVGPRNIPLITMTMCFRGVPYVGPCGRLIAVNVLVGMTAQSGRLPGLAF